MVLENILSQEIVQKLGWTLLHFVWQAAAVALLVGILQALLRNSSANLRYIVTCTALGLIVLLSIVTIQLVTVSTPQPIANIEPAPATIIPPAQQIKEIPALEINITEGTVHKETAGTVYKASWKQHAVNLLEPALPYLVTGWLLGVFGLSLWHLGGWAQLQRLRRKMVAPVDDSIHIRLRQLSEKLHVKQAVQLLESALVQVPTVVGWLRPVILLPASALTGLSSEQLEALLAHELAHIRRHDYLVNMLQTVIETLGFYHPAVWWVSHKIRIERENCCDDLAVAISGDRVSYARALTSMEEIRAGRSELAVAATGGNLFGRIRRLVAADSSENHHLSWIPSAIAIMLIVALALPTTLALSRRPSNESRGIESSLLENFADPKVNAEGQQILKQMAEVNCHWLTAPSPEVENYSYDFILYDREGNEPTQETIKVKHPTKVNSKWRQGITYDSVLHRLISNPSSTIIRKIRKDQQLIQLDFIFRDFTEIECGNGISHSWKGYFSGMVKTGSLWLDAEKIVPVKVKAGWLVEYYSEYVEADKSHYVPLQISVGNESTRYHWQFGFYEPGLWLFENATYRQDEESQPRMLASINNLKINKRPAVKTKISVVEVPELNDGRQVKDRKTGKPRKSVALTMTEQGLSFEGQITTWNQFGSLLADVPEPENTGLKFVPAAESHSSEKLKDMKTRISILSRELGFGYLSCINDDVNGPEQSSKEQFFTAPLEFDRDIYIRQSATGQFKQKYYRSEKGWGTDATEQHKEPATVYINSIHFQKSLFRGEVSAKIKIVYDSWPRAKWRIVARLLDNKGNSLAQASDEFDTNGYILSGKVLKMSSEPDFSFGRVANVSKAAAFEIAVTPLPENEGSLNDPFVMPDETIQSPATKEQEQLDKILAKYANEDSTDKSGNNSRNVRESVENYIAAALAGEDEKAAEYTYPGTAVAAQTNDMREILQGQDIKIVAACIGEWNTLAISSLIQADQGRIGSIVFELKKVILEKKVLWLIDEIDLNAIDSIGEQIHYFIKVYPDAKMIIINPDTYTNKQTEVKVVSDEGRIEGRIIDIDTGRGISGVQLAVAPNSSPESNERFACTSTGDGTFAIGGLQSGEYLLQGDFPSVDVDVVSGRCTNDVLIGVRRGQTMPAPEEITVEQQSNGQILIGMRMIEMPADAIEDLFESNESPTSELLVRHGHEIAGRLLTLSQERKDAKQIIAPQMLLNNNSNGTIAMIKQEFFVRNYEPIEGEPGKLAPQLQHIQVGWKFNIYAKILENGEKVHIKLATRQQEPGFETRQYRPGYDYQIPSPPDIFVTELTARNGEPFVISRLRHGETAYCLIVTPSAILPERQPEPLLGKKLPQPDNIQNMDNLKQAEGKPTLICFWDMNQRPSRNLVSELAKREKGLAEKNVTVYLVHTSNVEPAKLKEWLDNQNVPFACGSIENDAADVLFRWGVRAQPWLILTDENRTVRAEGFSLEQLDEKLQETGKPAAARTRIVHFPDDRTVGNLKLRDTRPDIGWDRGYLSLPGWALLGPAQGDVSVPAGEDLRLEVSGDVTDFSFLSDLKPNNLQVLILSNKKISDEDLIHLKGLTGLLALSLDTTPIENAGLAHLAALTSLKDLSLFNTKVSDAGLEHLSPLKSLKRLILFITQVRGPGLKCLQNLTSLVSLDLAATPITDESLVHVAEITWLKELQLQDTDITNKGLTHLKSLRSLEMLILGNTNLKQGYSPITDDGLVYLKGLDSLKDLHLLRTRATDTGLAYLSNLKTLEALDLKETRLTGEGLAYLKDLPALTYLNLEKTGVTEVGLKYLKEMTNLRVLSLDGENISENDLKDLEKALPDCKVTVRTANSDNSVPEIPVLSKSAPTAEDKPIVKVDLAWIEIPSGSQVDSKTTNEIKNVLGDKIAIADSPVAADLLRDTAGATAAVKDESAGDKRVTQEQFKTLFDLLASRGLIKILLNPTLEVADGQTAKISSKQKIPNSQDSIEDSIEITPTIRKNGNIVLQVNLDWSLKSAEPDANQPPIIQRRKISTGASISSGESVIIGGMIQQAVSPDADGNVKVLQSPSRELMCIITASIVAPADDETQPMETLNFQNVEVQTAIEKLAEWTGKTIIPPADLMKQKITIYSPEQMPRSEAAAMILNSLRSKGYTAEQTDDTIYLKSLPEEQPGTGKTQIMIDTKILTVSDEFLKYIGLDPNSVASSEGWSDYLVHSTDDSASFIIDKLHADLLLRNVAARMRTNKDIQMLQKPQVLALSGKKVEIHILDSEYYMLIAPNEPNGSSKESESKSHRIELGTTIRLIPTLTPDGENIELDFEWEHRRLRGIKEHTGPDGKKQKVPQIDVDSIKTPCTIPDGKTLLIAGKKIIEQKKKKPGKPGLADMPLIGRFFYSPSQPEQTMNLLIMVTPSTDIKAPSILQTLQPLHSLVDPNDPLIKKLEEKFKRSDGMSKNR